MRKPGFMICGILCLILGFVFLTGCDIEPMGLGHKKQDSSQKQPDAAVTVGRPLSAQAPRSVQAPCPAMSWCASAAGH